MRCKVCYTLQARRGKTWSVSCSTTVPGGPPEETAQKAVLTRVTILLILMTKLYSEGYESNPSLADAGSVN